MNEQDPLAQLRDIHVPDPVGWWPPAPGWWILALLLLAGLALAAGLLYLRHLRRGYRRAACRELDEAWARMQTDADRDRYVHDLSQILRRTALTAYPAPPVSGLHGPAWLQFLDGTSAKPGTEFSRGPGRDLLSLPYRPVPTTHELRPLHDLTMSWLAEHRRLRPAQLRALLAAQDPVREGNRAAV
ncbi:DUF4381 domain-containing protein [Proteobacteria bacterium 005FR1]|nr:DUF4381 domain-containing protein [Proteobacteria bacterium 005FR1]